MGGGKKFHAVPEVSHAQEFLASERTFLSWIRTSIAVLSFGIAIVKFDVSKGVGVAMVVFGGALSAVGVYHYRRTNAQIIHGKVEADNLLVLWTSLSVIALSVAVIIYLIFQAAKNNP